MTRVLTTALVIAVLALPSAGRGEEGQHAAERFQGAVRRQRPRRLASAIDFGKRVKLSGEELEKAQKAANDKVLPHWTVENGVLINDGKGGNLATAKDYRNFELRIDWKIEPKGDSGIYLRGQPQVQIWDSDSLDPKKYKLEYQKGSGAVEQRQAGRQGAAQEGRQGARRMEHVLHRHEGRQGDGEAQWRAGGGWRRAG